MNRYRATACVTVLLLGAGACFSAPVYADCTVREVIRFVERGESSRDIREKCQHEVAVRDCSLTQVMQMARKGDSEREIYERCGRN